MSIAGLTDKLFTIWLAHLQAIPLNRLPDQLDDEIISLPTLSTLLDFPDIPTEPQTGNPRSSPGIPRVLNQTAPGMQANHVKTRETWMSRPSVARREESKETR